MRMRDPGIHEETFDLSGASHPGGSHRLTLSVPADDESAEPRPLVVVLHYAIPGDVTPPFYGRGVLEKLAIPALEELGAVMVAPDSVAGDWTTSASEAVVLEAIDQVQGVYGTDPQRVVLLGYSKGGFGAWHLAARHPKCFSAAIPVSARPGEVEHGHVPFFVIHSRDDELIPVETVEERVMDLRARGVQLELQIVDGITHFETGRFAPALRGAVPWLRGTWG